MDLINQLLAQQLGLVAFKKGISRIPLLDADLMKVLKACCLEQCASIQASWSQGWDQANRSQNGLISQ